jgi:uncharacterized membrane protein YkoI
MRIEKDLEIALALAKGILKGAELDEKNEAYIYELLKVYPNFDKLKEVIKKIKSNTVNGANS